ncbi:hypothetical protein [Jiangella sp. DSM 45060]|uniref:hypothetical protein n=1 Tax=Jiangella sp. DSM 45060 TaxID=1798224 RepID=UPI00087D80E1|nr:hypothetical protein [Jiangella sp. DSM 45060]SDT69572.1 hypothetical protein SAMN04515669_6041 [Jiangella sp. DSM 45060]
MTATARPLATLSGEDIGRQVIVTEQHAPNLTTGPTRIAGVLDRIVHQLERTWVVLNGRPFLLVPERCTVEVIES